MADNVTIRDKEIIDFTYGNFTILAFPKGTVFDRVKPGHIPAPDKEYEHSPTGYIHPKVDITRLSKHTFLIFDRRDDWHPAHFIATTPYALDLIDSDGTVI